MADTKLSDLPQVSGQLPDDAEFYVNNNNSSEKILGLQLKDYVTGLKDPVALVNAIPTVVDSFLVDDYQNVRWNLVIRNSVTKKVEEQWVVQAWHDGTLSADATNAGTKYTINGIGPATSNVIFVDLNDSSTSQTIRLVVTASAINKEAIVNREIVVSAV